MPGGKTENEADSSLGLRRRRRAARLDIAGDRSGVVMPVDRARPGAKREAGASQGDSRFMTKRRCMGIAEGGKEEGVGNNDALLQGKAATEWHVEV
jgi:hypothetical protein